MTKDNKPPPPSRRALSILRQYVETEVTLKKDEQLFKPGDPIDYLYIVLSGIVVMNQPIMDGRQISLRLCKAGDFIGDSSLFSNHGQKHVLHAMGFRESLVGLIHRDDLDQLLEKDASLARSLMKEISENALRDNMKMIDLVMYGRRGALYSTLIRLSNSYGIEKNGDIFIDLPMTNQELANFCGASRENINRLLKDLRDKKIVSIENKFITIHDLDFLRESLNCSMCPVSLCSIH